MIYKNFKQWVKGRVLEVGQPRKQFYSQEDFDLIEMGWGYGFDAGVQWQKSQQALDKKAENARELGLNYENERKDMIEVENRLKKQEEDIENTFHWHALNYRTASTENAQAMFEALENYVRETINANTNEVKKWVGLTDEDMDKLLKIQRREWSWKAVFLDVEAVLKEKNI